jgi:predicted RNase H-like HicB family nuclease
MGRIAVKYAILIERTDNGYSAYAPDLPGCIAAGDTFEETRQLIEEAANFHVEGMIEDGETIPEPLNTAVEVEVEVPTVEALQQAVAKNAG